ncbi:hypothetical protein PENTCL1PPCAC_27639 [Pristionchus entomophagus]|uniref:Uncharacterized protein n=1 Tax=Pristionchus entomophagus TaxID=358040 RepID=A0AAV5UET6_9BILA|nr:hypothetical protein PENTCL1PPCAC_27639 [Pristionchus entomophagus]
MLDVLAATTPLAECVCQVLPIAHRFEDKELLSDCEYTVLDTTADLGELLLLTDRYGLGRIWSVRIFKLRLSGSKQMMKGIRDLRNSPHWEEFSDDLKPVQQLQQLQPLPHQPLHPVQHLHQQAAAPPRQPLHLLLQHQLDVEVPPNYFPPEFAAAAGIDIPW